MNRRLFLASGTCFAAQAACGLATGLLIPGRVVAQWPADLFFSRRLDDALSAVTGNTPFQQSPDVEILADTIAENGASVPVTILSRLPNTRAITLFSDANPNPAIARYRIGPGLEPRLGVRIKMGASGQLIALAETDAGFFSTRKAIKVTAGGCA